jgi:hypothetical protein
MQGRIILPGEVGSQLEPALTWEGLTNMLGDMRKAAQRMPDVIMVSEHDRRDLNQEILGHSTNEVAKADQAPEHDGACVGFIQGVMVRSHPDVPRGKARLIYPPVRAEAKPLPSGKIISVGPVLDPQKAIRIEGL